MTKEINIIRGASRQVGKSFFSCILASYYNFLSKKLVLINGDSNSFELNKFHQNIINCNFDASSEKELCKLDKILYSSNDLLINLPGDFEGKINNELKGIDRWFIFNSLKDINVLLRLDKNIIHWHLSDGSLESLKSFKFVVRTYGKVHKIVLVNNQHFSDWDKRYEEFSQIVDRLSNCYSITLPKMESWVKDAIYPYNFSWDEIVWKNETKTFAKNFMLTYIRSIFPQLVEVVDFKPSFNLDLDDSWMRWMKINHPKYLGREHSFIGLFPELVKKENDSDPCNYSF